MNKFLKILVRKLIPLTLMASCSVAAATKEIDDAVKRYYAGFPEQAISMLKPLALEGDVDAQHLLGNILYSLSAAGKYMLIDESVRWYKMAAGQNSAVSNYALGVIFQNKWVNSRNEKDAATAIVYYRKAADLGYTKAQTYLTKIKSRSGISQQEATALVKDQQAKPVLETKSRIETPEIELDNMGSGKVLTPVDVSTSINIAKKSEAVEESATTSGSLDQSAQIADNPDDEVRITITLADLASQCHNYTEAGFNLYAETIKDALVSGNASVTAMSPDSSESGTYSIDLINSQFDSAVFVNLRKVPAEVAKTFDEGEKFGITGIIIDSKVVGSNCAISLLYQSATG